ncbi:hypothetical protein phytr_3530 [Candidatus Phycorickettsia trachydisci]|uniref:Uncharacterized protein n=1 Tax=Candidatus Phycorickettsia trachydisci TaxID=2115978 RepID=A0A2P1P7U0_9RICK|nr:DUF2972 domain-containing protein [Candidatus Phycorickettsia trachydisci]AVP87305.1 hypothetical protein phytr_3530 [Candidatus Phycorickettsia trachydisci]
MTTKDEFQVDTQIVQGESQAMIKDLNELDQLAKGMEGLLAGISADSYCRTEFESREVPTRNVASHLMGQHSKQITVGVEKLDKERLNKDIGTARDITHNFKEIIKSLTSQHSGSNSLDKNEEKILSKLQEILDGNKLFKGLCDETMQRYLDQTSEKIGYVMGLVQGDAATEALSEMEDDFVMPPVGQDGNFSS